MEKPKDDPEEEEEEESKGGISMKDTEEPGGKVSQPGDDTGASELSEANPEPVPDTEEEDEEEEEEDDATLRNGKEAAQR